MGVQSSVIPLVSQLAGHGLSYTAVSNPAVVAAPWAVPAASWPAAVSVGSWPPAAPAVIAGHGPAVIAGHGPALIAGHGAAVVAAHAPAVVAAAHAAPAVVVAPVAHEGVYTAQTRGAVHTAPLSGHIQSVASINAAPAPGTL